MDKILQILCLTVRPTCTDNCGMKIWLCLWMNHTEIKFSCYHDSETWYCSGKTKIQDFEPKTYSFSFCNECKREEPGNLYGLYYNVTIYDELNETSCLRMGGGGLRRWRIDRCERSPPYAAIPNQIGDTDPGWDITPDGPDPGSPGPSHRSRLPQKVSLKHCTSSFVMSWSLNVYHWRTKSSFPAGRRAWPSWMNVWACPLWL